MAYHKILAVINEHSGSTVAARYALTLAAASGAELVLYSARAEGGDLNVVRQTERHLDHLYAESLLYGIAVTRISETGTLTRLLPRRVLAEGADLVFYPLTPGELYGDPLQRQTTHQLLQTIRADLAVIRVMHMGKPHPRHILAPVAAVVSDREARVKFLIALAKGFHSQLTLFHRPDAGKADLPDDFTKLRNELRQHHLPVLERSGSGSIARSIALEAVSHHSDLIVLGASERGALRRLFFGNPAGDVMRQPPCNAILFRPLRESP